MIRWTQQDLDEVIIPALVRHGRSGYAFALEDIGEAMGLNGPATRTQVLHALDRRGYRGFEDVIRRHGHPATRRGSMPAPRQERAPAVDGRPTVTPKRDGTDADFERLTAAVRKNARTIGELCDELDVSPRRVRELLERAAEHGLDLDVSDDLIGHRPSDPTAERDVQVQGVDGRHLFAIASDIHVGSKHFLRAPFLDFVDKFRQMGGRDILCPGDMLDGVYDHSRWEQNMHGGEAQAEGFAELLPRDMRFWAILGNHDETLSQRSGVSVERLIEDACRRAGHQHVSVIGARGGCVRLRAPGEARGLLVELWHPSGKAAYSLSYRLQNKIRDMAVGAKPDVVLAGHFHQQCYFVQRGVHAMQCGTWQGGKSAFGKSLGTSPSIGGWIVEYALTPEGTVREFSPTWHAYYEQETVREVDLG